MTLVCGISSSGKTTYAQALSGAVIAWDNFRGGGHFKTDQCNRRAAEVENAVVEGIYIRKWQREDLCNIIKERKVCIWLDTPLDECIKRERTGRCRGDNFIKSQYERFESPTYSEGWDEIYIVKDGIETLMPREWNYGESI